MKSYPSLPAVSAAPSELFESGHLWIQELLDGSLLRFRIAETGQLVFGDETRVYEREEPPEPYHSAVQHVRESFDRTALADGANDPTAFVFFGQATYRRRIDYDWNRLPPFVGFDIWAIDEERFLPPDVVERVFDRLGLRAVNTFERELPARQFSVARFDVPDSAWYDGPAAGVVFRNKRGLRAVLRNPAVGDGDEQSVRVDGGVETLVDRWLTDDRVVATAEAIEAANDPVHHGTIRERLHADIVRERYAQLYHSSPALDRRAVRERLDERVIEWFAESGR